MIWLTFGCMTAGLVTSCGQEGTATKADPNNVYTAEHWTGVAFPDYRDLSNFTPVGPFDTARQCVAAANASGAINSNAGVFECCIIDDEYENYPGELERRKVCEHNFGLSSTYDSELHDAYVQCADPADLCNERGQLVRDLVRNNQRNADIRASNIEYAMQELFSAESDLETKENAGVKLTRAYNRAIYNVSSIDKRIYSDSSAKTHSEIEKELALGRDASQNEDEKRVFKEALTGLNGIQIKDILTEIVEKASTLIESKTSPTPTLDVQTKVDAVIKYDQRRQLRELNSLFDGMTSAEIAEKYQGLSTIGLIRIEKKGEQGIYYSCTSGVGNAYRLKYEMHAVNFSSGQITASIELLGGAPPEKIESHKCEGVGSPPDWSGYFVIAETN